MTEIIPLLNDIRILLVFIVIILTCSFMIQVFTWRKS